ncbi:MAG TPA: MOSC N-terminal beta barrel domain-containing protein [Burkholderiaceae bacterium]|nr:MOSC N-terminal beta barrel domain-containing protein [Burkholderiaceae bacterium]
MSLLAFPVPALPVPALPAGEVSALISRLFVYPIKSCAGVEVEEATLTETGLEFDRAWMVVDQNGRFVTQRQMPRMALIQPKLRFSDLVLRAPGMLALHIALDAVEQPVRVTVWKDEVAAYDMGDVAAQWFSDFLGAKLRLVRFDPEHQRLSSKQWTGDVDAPNQFSDGYAVLVISQAALNALNDRLQERGATPVGMERFRPNVVISDAPAPAQALDPHAEDHLRDLRVATPQGAALLRVVKPCARCEIPNIDPVTAEIGVEPGAALAIYRGDSRLDGAVTFGMNAIVIDGVDHQLRRGTQVEATLDF